MTTVGTREPRLADRRVASNLSQRPCLIASRRAMQVALSMEREGVAMDAGTQTLVRALQADEWITGQEEIHVDEEGNLDLR